ncbi:histidine kinase [Nonomuraea muscovyensis]|uniref:sensor histidine kinase n=1 Tax=Nonomuraea muscovyensis TaxID=1124761 RepID=UPI0033C379DB
MRVNRQMAPVLLGVAVFTVSLGSASGGLGVVSGLPFPLPLAAAAAAGTAAWRMGRSWWPLAVVGAAAYVALAMWPPLVVASYFAGTRLRRTRDIALYLGVAGVVLAASVAAGRLAGGTRELATATPANALLMIVAAMVLPLVYGLWIRSRRDVLAAARERADRLEREQVLRAEQARTQERARIAREMHDVVAHRVSLMVLHAGALELGATDERSAGTAAVIGGIGREALADLRGLLGVLRSPEQPVPLAPQPTLADLDRLLDQSRALGIPVTRHDHGEPRPLGSTVERTAYRVVQEALTNVHKHAAGAPTDVHVRFLAGELRVEVCNRPAATGPVALPGSGWGLAGLRERVELLGGTLRTGPRDGGFGVVAAIPVEAA